MRIRLVRHLLDHFVIIVTMETGTQIPDWLLWDT